MDEKIENKSELVLTIGFLLVLASAVFILDSITPKGYLDWFFYLVIIFYEIFKLPKKYLAFSGYTCALLTALGYFVSPDGISPELTVINRMIGILIIWMLTSLLLKQYKEGELKSQIEQQFNALLNSLSDDGIVYFDTDGKIAISNKKFANILGYRENELAGKNILEFIHPNYRSAFLISREKLYFNFQKSDFFKGKLIKKNKEIRAFSIALNITQSPDNDFKFFTAYFNLTENEKASGYIPASRILLKETPGEKKLINPVQK